MLTGPFAYEESKNPGRGSGFYPLLMAALRVADSENFARIRAMFPDVAAELQARYNAPGGELDGEQEAAIEKMTRPPTDVVTEWWRMGERLAAAEDVCAMYSWSRARNDTDRDKALHELWLRWVNAGGATDPEAFPHLTDELVAELARNRDATRAETLRRMGFEGPSS